MSKVLPLRHGQPVDDLWLAKCRVAKAITLIYCEKRLYEGLDILCDLVGLGSMRDPLASVAEVNEWLNKMLPEIPFQPDVPNSKKEPSAYLLSKLAVGRKCPECNRVVLSLAPKVRKDRLPTCPTCGRRFNNKRK